MFELSDYSTIRVIGSDSQCFLQGQLTADIRLVTEGNATLAACCLANGKMLASMMVIADQSSYLLWLPSSQIPILLEHFKKYALFSKVEFQAPIGFYSYGFLDPPQTDYHIKFQLPKMKLSVLLLSHRMGHDTYQNIELWKQYLMEADLAFVTPILSERWNPLMFYYDKLGGISFNKGCYLGQEIIARAYYKGQIKRHLYTLTSKKTLAKPGDSVYNQKKHVVGTIVNSAQINDQLMIQALLQDAALQHSLWLNGTSVLGVTRGGCFTS